MDRHAECFRCGEVKDNDEGLPYCDECWEIRKGRMDSESVEEGDVARRRMELQQQYRA